MYDGSRDTGNDKMKRIFTRHVKSAPHLGRWHRPKCRQSLEIKILMANHDSCGDEICGSPANLKSDIERILNRNPKNKKKE